jgi:hypothetical protein
MFYTNLFLSDMRRNLFCQRGNRNQTPVAEGGEDCRVSVGYCELTTRVVHTATC